MYRGTRKYKCPKCGETFTAPDVELNATAFSAPQRCPKCGQQVSGASGPVGIVGTLLGLFQKGKLTAGGATNHYKAGRIVQTGRMSAKDLHDNLMGGLPTSHGHWTGETGNSHWLPDGDYTPKNRLYNNMYGKTWAQILRDNHCEEGIVFTNGEIDFARTGVVKAEVTIPGGIATCFSEEDIAKGKRTRLHDTAFAILAKQMGKTVNEVMRWKDENVYVWHECIDLNTLQLVPREIHDNVTHQGGVAVLKASM